MNRSIEVSKPIPVAFEAACLVLVEDPATMLSGPTTDSRRRFGHVLTDLAVTFGSGLSVHQTVAVRLGAVDASAEEAVLPLRWSATARAGMLPTFSGEFEMVDIGTGTRLRLRGDYRVPLGLLGRVGDRLVGRRLVRRSLSGLVDELARRLEAEVGRPDRPSTAPQAAHATGPATGPAAAAVLGTSPAEPSKSDEPPGDRAAPAVHSEIFIG